MSSQSLPSRLRILENGYRQLVAQIQTLSNWTPTPGTDSTARTDLSSEIHQSLKEQEDALELLRQELDDYEPATSSRWTGGGSVLRPESEQESERERNATTIARLAEDLRSAHRTFRQAQLKAKRNEDSARRRERDELFAKRGSDGDSRTAPRKQNQAHLTQDELATNAATDVTKSLRRMHDLLLSNVQQNEYAQQTLEESQQALASLGEQYSGMDSLLKSSRGLVSLLVRSTKSDTWYLETAFMILCVTLAWLVFRRLLYGPLWWFVWQPLRLAWWLCATALSSVGIIGRAKANSTLVASSHPQSVSLSTGGRPTFHHESPMSVRLPEKGGGWTGPASQSVLDESVVEETERIAGLNPDDADNVGVNIDDISNEERKQQEDMPRNSKKRMMEVEKENVRARDEL